MAKDAFQLQGNAAKIYEEQKIPAVFGPLVAETLKHIKISADDRVLDIACGTGVVARTITSQTTFKKAIVGIDLNQGMIDTAASLTASSGSAFEWHVGDATVMPFKDGQFSLALCQQGLQFFGDEAAALREFRRVLEPGGRLVFTIWHSPSPLFLALADSFRREVDDKTADLSLAPFSYPRHAELIAILSEARFQTETDMAISVDRTISDPVNDIPKEILGNPIGPAVSAHGEAVMQKITEEVIAATASFRQGSALVIPQRARLIVATRLASRPNVSRAARPSRQRQRPPRLPYCISGGPAFHSQVDAPTQHPAA